MTTAEHRGRAWWFRRRFLVTAAVVAVPPMLALLVVVALRGGAEGVAQPPVEIREEHSAVGVGTVTEALAALEARTGVADLPTRLPNGDYRLIYVDSVIPASGSGLGPYAVIAYQDRRAPRGSWFSVSQFAAGAMRFHAPGLPESLPEVQTSVAGAKVWLVGTPPDMSSNWDPPPGYKAPHMQFFARTERHDRLINFEGPEYPNQELARKVIESILQAESRRYQD